MHISRVTAPAVDSLTAARPPRSAPAPAASGVWPAWLETILARRAERRQLLALEERDLRDIGLTQAEARALARKPLWWR